MIFDFVTRALFDKVLKGILPVGDSNKLGGKGASELSVANADTVDNFHAYEFQSIDGQSSKPFTDIKATLEWLNGYMNWKAKNAGGTAYKINVDNADTVDGYHAYSLMRNMGDNPTDYQISQIARITATNDKFPGAYGLYVAFSCEKTASSGKYMLHLYRYNGKIYHQMTSDQGEITKEGWKPLCNEADLANKLDKTGGQVYNGADSAPFSVKGHGTPSYIEFKNTAHGTQGYLGFYTPNNPVYAPADKSAVYHLVHTGNIADHALPIGGGTLTGAKVDILRLRNTASEYNYLIFEGASGSLGAIGFANTNKLVYVNDALDAAYPLLHSGNVGDYAATSEYGTFDLAFVYNGSTVFTISSCYYHKVGRYVYISGSKQNVTSDLTLNAGMYGTGLPFTPAVNNGIGMVRVVAHSGDVPAAQGVNTGTDITYMISSTMGVVASGTVSVGKTLSVYGMYMTND